MTAATQQAGSPDNEPVRVNHTVRNIVIALIVVAVMSAGRVVERGDVCNVFAAPQQAVTKRFIDTVSGSAIGSITYEFSGDDALVRDFLGGAVTFQRCHRLRHGGGPHSYEDAIAAAVRGRQGGDAMSPWSHAYDIAGHQTDWTVIRKSTRR
ncbi:ATP-binding protein [Bifidobacterium bifidum]|nr:ATP-binding protein [Bifidobacterium bifidum]